MRNVTLALMLLVAGMVSGDPLKSDQIARRDAARAKAATFIAEHRAELGLASTADVREKKVSVDKWSAKIRYEQLYAGIPVLYGEIILNVIDGKPVHLVFNKLKGTLSAPTKAKVTAAQALSAATTASKITTELDHSDPILRIVPRESFGSQPTEDHLAWELDLYRANDDTPPAYSHRFYVDALDGSIIAELDQTGHAAGISGVRSSAGARGERPPIGQMTSISDLTRYSS